MAVTSHTESMASGFAPLARSFADGIEFEETFPASGAPAAKPAPSTASSRPTVIGENEAPRREQVAPAPRTEAAAAKTSEMTDAAFEARLEQRVRSAEAQIKETMESARATEEARLAEWVKDRRDEEERRLAQWTQERRAEIERSLEARQRDDADGLKAELQRMLVDWQGGFEKRFRSELAEVMKSVAQRDRAAVEQRPDARAVIAAAPSVRDLGRVLRDLLADITETASFALALHHASRDEVVYRYRVAAEDVIGATLRGEAIDDGPESAVAHSDEWLRGHRVLRIGERNVTIHTAQYPVRRNGMTIGAVTLQSANEPIADEVLSRIASLVETASPRLTELRAGGSFRSA